jgi:hypothetical protein
MEKDVKILVCEQKDFLKDSHCLSESVLGWLDRNALIPKEGIVDALHF